MRSCHDVFAGFDDPNFVSCAGLVPVMMLAERAGLHDLARAHVQLSGSAGSNADVKVAGMVAGSDTIDAMELPRQGALFFTWRHHAVFTGSAEPMLAAVTYRDHAIVEKVIAELKNGPLAHLRSAQFNANAAWVHLAATSFDLPRAAGPWPPGSTPGPRPPRSVPSSSQGQPASPAPRASCICTCPSDGPEKPLGGRCSPPPRDDPPARPDHPAPTGATKDPGDDPERPAPHPRPNQKRRDADPIGHSPKTDRWIEAQTSPDSRRSRPRPRHRLCAGKNSATQGPRGYMLRRPGRQGTLPPAEGSALT